MTNGLSSALLDLNNVRKKSTGRLHPQSPGLITLLKSVLPITDYQFRFKDYHRVRYGVYSKFLPPWMPPTLCSEKGMFRISVKERKRNEDERTRPYLVGGKDESS